MDPLAHTLFGAGLAETGLKRKTALATGTLILGANAPDVDVIAAFWGSDASLWFRRGWTHGLPALLVWPFLLTGFMLLFDRWVRRPWLLRRRGDGPPGPAGPPPGPGEGRDKQRGAGPGDHSGALKHPAHPAIQAPNPRILLGLAFLAVWSHPLLDGLNTYGIRLFMPLDGTWFYGDALFIMDPWMWLLAGAPVVLARSRGPLSIAGWTVLAAATSALVVGVAEVPMAVKVIWAAALALLAALRYDGRAATGSEPIARYTLLALGVYVLVMVAGSQLTVWQARQELTGRGAEPQRIMADPQPARLLVREGVAATESHYYRFRVNWLRGLFASTPATQGHAPAGGPRHSEQSVSGTTSVAFELIGDAVPRAKPEPEVVRAALQAPSIQGFRNWMRFPAYEVRRLDDGWRVLIRDLRFTDPGQQEPGPGIGMAAVELDEGLEPR